MNHTATTTFPLLMSACLNSFFHSLLLASDAVDLLGNCSISDQYLLLSDCGFFSFLSYDISGSSAPISRYFMSYKKPVNADIHTIGSSN